MSPINSAHEVTTGAFSPAKRSAAIRHFSWLLFTRFLYRIFLTRTGPPRTARRTGPRIGERHLSRLENMAKSGSRAGFSRLAARWPQRACPEKPIDCFCMHQLFESEQFLFDPAIPRDLEAL
jgi:hypothetical protein